MSATDEPDATFGANHRLILVREQDSQHSGSGCCGRLGGAHSMLGAAADFSHSRQRMNEIGVIWRRVRAEMPALTIDIVDPRNTMWLYPSLWREARRAGLGWRARLAVLARAGAPLAVVLDGEVLYAGELPAADIVVRRVLARLSGVGSA